MNNANTIKQSVFIDAILPIPSNKSLAIIRDIALILSFAFLTGISAKLKVEIGIVPITMQTFAVLLSGALLGSKRGFLSQLAYLSMGLAGLPLFARGGGISYLLSPTFGYIIGFILAASLIGWLSEKGWDKNLRTAVLAMLLGNLIIYAPGLLWLAKFVGFGKVLTLGFYPFIVGDALKIILAGLVLPIGWKIIQKSKKSYDV